MKTDDIIQAQSSDYEKAKLKELAKQYLLLNLICKSPNK
jgi:hypothetical protein